MMTSILVEHNLQNCLLHSLYITNDWLNKLYIHVYCTINISINEGGLTVWSSYCGTTNSIDISLCTQSQQRIQLALNSLGCSLNTTILKHRCAWLRCACLGRPSGESSRVESREITWPGSAQRLRIHHVRRQNKAIDVICGLTGRAVGSAVDSAVSRVRHSLASNMRLKVSQQSSWLHGADTWEGNSGGDKA